MKKKIISTKGIIVIVLVVVAVILGVVYWPKQSNAPEVPPAPGNSTSVGQGTSSAPAIATGTNNIVITPGWNVYENASYGLTVGYPQGWTIGSEQPVGVLDNFSGKYAADGSIPEGGAEIDAVKTNSYGPLDDVINTEVLPSSVTATSTISVAGVSCEELFYGASFSAGHPSKNIAVYCLKGTALVKIYLAYHADDAGGPGYVSTFNQILASAALAK